MTTWEFCKFVGAEGRSTFITFFRPGSIARSGPSHEFHHTITGLGQEGWELVAVLPQADDTEAWYFKRPASSPTS